MGQGFLFAFPDGTGKSRDELEAQGLNFSRTHTDVVIGGPATTEAVPDPRGSGTAPSRCLRSGRHQQGFTASMVKPCPVTAGSVTSCTEPTWVVMHGVSTPRE